MYTSDNAESFSNYGDTLIVCLGLLGKQAKALPAQVFKEAMDTQTYTVAASTQQWAQNAANTVSAPSAPPPHLAKHALLAQLVGNKGCQWGMQDGKFVIASAPPDANMPFGTDPKHTNKNEYVLKMSGQVHCPTVQSTALHTTPLHSIPPHSTALHITPRRTCLQVLPVCFAYKQPLISPSVSKLSVRAMHTALQEMIQSLENSEWDKHPLKQSSSVIDVEADVAGACHLVLQPLS